MEVADDSVIVTGKLGYQLHPSLCVDDPEQTPEDRQSWILDELKTGRKLRRADLEKKFRISPAIAKRISAS